MKRAKRGGGGSAPAETWSGCTRDALGVATHDLRTPLLAIRMGCDLLERGPAGRDPAASGLLQEVRQAGAELSGMIDHALALARLQAGLVVPEPEPVDLGELAAEVAAGAGPRAESRSVSLALEIPAGLPPALVDPVLLRQVLQELVENAIGFCPAGQQVTITAAVRPGAVRPLRLRVIDPGPGVPPALARAVFAPWVRVPGPPRGRSRGLGLGLTLARRLCHLMRARVRLLPGRDAGAIFEVVLPAAASATEAP